MGSNRFHRFIYVNYDDRSRITSKIGHLSWLSDWVFAYDKVAGSRRFAIDVEMLEVLTPLCGDDMGLFWGGTLGVDGGG